MNILFLCPSAYLSLHFMTGWKNAFAALGYGFKHLDASQEDLDAYLRDSQVDIIFTASGEGVGRLPPEEINARKIAVIIAGLPFNRFNASFDAHCPLADWEEVENIAKFNKKVVWSQHEPNFNEYFYSGYRELGIDVLYLPYCCDITQKHIDPQQEAGFDFFFVGGLAHKRKGNIKILKNILNKLPEERIKIYGDPLWTKLFHIPVSYTQKDENWQDFYRKAAISPNLHSLRQKNKMLALNDRTFHIPGFGGFQINDNPLARKFFAEDEMVVGETPKDFIDKFFYYLQKPEERIVFIQKAQRRILNDHSYFNRIASLFAFLKIDKEIVYNGVDKKAISFDNGRYTSISNYEKIYYWLETKFYQNARKVRKFLKKR